MATSDRWHGQNLFSTTARRRNCVSMDRPEIKSFFNLARSLGRTLNRLFILIRVVGRRSSVIGMRIILAILQRRFLSKLLTVVYPSRMAPIRPKPLPKHVSDDSRHFILLFGIVPDISFCYTRQNLFTAFSDHVPYHTFQRTLYPTLRTGLYFTMAQNKNKSKSLEQA